MPILKTLGKLCAIWLAMIGMLVMAALVVVGIAMIIRFRMVFAVALVFLGLAYLFTRESGVEVTMKPRLRRVVTDTGEVFYVADDGNQHGSAMRS